MNATAMRAEPWLTRVEWESDVSAGFVYLRPVMVAYVRVRGPYTVSSREAWAKVFAWLHDSGMWREVGCGYGLMRDDPKTVAPENCRYEACIELLHGFEGGLPEDFALQRIPGGTYFRARHIGTGQSETLKRLRDEEVPAKGFKVDAKRPFLEVYFDDPGRVAPDKARIDICIPVSIAAEADSGDRMAS